MEYANAANKYASGQQSGLGSAISGSGMGAATTVRAAESLVGHGGKNAERVGNLASRLHEIADRLCGGEPNKSSAMSMDHGPGFGGRMAGINSEISSRLSDCEAALSRIESFV